MESTFVVRRYININNITILDLTVVWDSMADNFVDTRADTFGEVVVIQRGWVTIPFDTCLMDDSVDFIRRNARPQGFAGNVKYLPSHPTRMS
eukprot:CAMPEP_0113512818 /NCGR_PEP_ID=MMETSP0014_2-20120614/39535_1 /TAXON_ID=2857 /ORGANISM="Nitzschia sp." /LENGTH=91 /DNA_ID=CAMNT_0000409187 /DNA_START=510 /DNA_END=785 /DNA_ORIENTATION=+ /assembly_acc=CAM_ASM_000159